MRFLFVTLFFLSQASLTNAEKFIDAWNGLGENKKQFGDYHIALNEQSTTEYCIAQFIQNTKAMLEKIEGKDAFYEKGLGITIEEKKTELETGISEGNTHLLAIKNKSGELAISVFLKELKNNEDNIWFLTGFRMDEFFLTKLINEQKTPKALMEYIGACLLNTLSETAEIAKINTILTTDFKSSSPIGFATRLGFKEDETYRSLIGYDQEPYQSNIMTYSLNLNAMYSESSTQEEDDFWDLDE